MPAAAGFESPLTILRRLPATVRLLIFGTFVNKLGTFILPYLAIVLRRDFHLDEGQIGRLLFAYGGGSMGSILAGGYLTDWMGRRRTLLVSLLGSGIVAMLMGFSTSVRMFVPLLILLGFVADLYRPASSAIIGDVLPSGQRAEGFAGVRLANNLGFAIGVTLGGIIADWSWRGLFLGDGATTFLCGLVVLAFIPETQPASRAEALDAKGSSPWRDGVYWQLMLATFAMAFIICSFLSVLPLTITEAAGYPARVYGFLVGVNGLIIAALEVTLAAWLTRYRRLRVAALGLVLVGLGFGLTGWVLHWAWFLLTVVIWTMGEILSSPQKLAFVADWAPPAGRGRYLGLLQATWSLALALNPIVLLPLHARLGERAFWSLMLVLALPGAWLLIRLDRTADRPELLRGRTPDAALEVQSSVTMAG